MGAAPKLCLSPDLQSMAELQDWMRAKGSRKLVKQETFFGVLYIGLRQEVKCAFQRFRDWARELKKIPRTLNPKLMGTQSVQNAHLLLRQAAHEPGLVAFRV